MLVQDLIAELSECHPLAEVSIGGYDLSVEAMGRTALTVELTGEGILSEEELESRLSDSYREAEEAGEEALKEAESAHEESVEDHRAEARADGYAEGVHAAHEDHDLECDRDHT